MFNLNRPLKGTMLACLAALAALSTGKTLAQNANGLPPQIVLPNSFIGSSTGSSIGSPMGSSWGSVPYIGTFRSVPYVGSVPYLGSVPNIGSFRSFGSVPYLGSVPSIGSIPSIPYVGSIPYIGSIPRIGALPYSNFYRPSAFSGAFSGNYARPFQNYGIPNSGRLSNTTVIQTAPSKASGNYYSGSVGDASASGGYYSSSSSSGQKSQDDYAYLNRIQRPKSLNNSSDNYWGSSGNPFPKDLKSVPWAP